MPDKIQPDKIQPDKIQPDKIQPDKIQPDKIQNETSEHILGEFPYDVVDYNNMQHVFWLKNSVVDSAITGIIFLCPKGKITFVNKAALAIWGWEEKALLGNYAAQFAQSWERLVDIFNIVHKKGSWAGEIVTIRKDGSFNTVYLQMTLIRNAKGHPICCMCSFVDVTNMKYYENQIRIMESALASSINGMVITDVKGNITYANDAFYKMCGGYLPDEVIGKNAMRFASVDEEAIELQKTIQKHGKWFGEQRMKRRDGSIFDVQLSVSTIKESNAARSRDTVRALFVFVDISEQKKAERELKESHEELERRVMERTADLQTLNHHNLKEIEVRKQAEKMLLKKETALVKKARELEEMNIAMKVLLKRRDKDKEHLEKDIFINVEKNIVPYIKKLLNRKKIGALEREYILTIDAHMKEIISPFMHKLEITYKKLTPTEIMVANLIRDAKTTKEIAAMLNISIQTVEFHRKNIRKKLKLNFSKINLRSHLLSLT